MLKLREPDLRTLRRTPITGVTAQARFGTPIELSKNFHGTQLRDSLVKAGLRFRLERVQRQGISVAVGPSGVLGHPVPQPADAGWKLTLAQTTILVMPEAISVETNQYSEWADFSHVMEQALRSVETTLDPDGCARLGLRFVNNIHGREFQTTSDFSEAIEQWLLGPVTHPGLQVGLATAQQQYDFELDEATLATVRSGVFADQANQGRLTFLLDLDAYTSEFNVFSTPDLMQTASRLDTWIVQLFQTALTPTYWRSLADGS